MLRMPDALRGQPWPLMLLAAVVPLGVATLLVISLQTWAGWLGAGLVLAAVSLAALSLFALRGIPLSVQREPVTWRERMAVSPTLTIVSVAARIAWLVISLAWIASLLGARLPFDPRALTKASLISMMIPIALEQLLMRRALQARLETQSRSAGLRQAP